ncbi:MAG: NAD(+) synthase [Clostridiales bacterium]|nr:NAD(+) synthase [Clostridiales bacterium]
MYGFVRCAAAVPKLKVADCKYNAGEIISLINAASLKDVDLIVFPELCITGYTCADLFMQSALLTAAENALEIIAEATKGKNIAVVVGLPVNIGNSLYNCSAAIFDGVILGSVPKTYIPNYSEYYEKRWFKSGKNLNGGISLCGQVVPIGTNLVFAAEGIENFTFGIEICEDLWANIPPSCSLTLSGALIIANTSASNELATKNEYRVSLVSNQSARCICGYIYSSAGIGESTQDMVFSGHSIICENGSVLNEGDRFSLENELIISDIDTELLANDRRKNMTYGDFDAPEANIIPFPLYDRPKNDLMRHIRPRPFVPNDDDALNRRCSDIFSIQVGGLAKRVMHTNAKSLVIGISGGLDSTLALLVAVKVCDYLKIDRSTVLGITMPGFGTTDRTYNNALSLMKALGVKLMEIPIGEASMLHFDSIGHNPEIHDVTYENTQARERTQILMDLANKENGLVVGTGDLSELALGWATYNGDHMSMYGVNSGVPKTLVRVLVDWVSRFGNLDSEAVEVLRDILDTPVSPELLPPDKDNNINQKTEEIVGPYELHDFFLYYVVRCGFSPRKIYYLALNAFNGVYDSDTILKWLKNFYRRFFSQQFKRSCLPDGPKVGTINLSPRGDWRMPSDAMNTVWMEELEEL